MVISCVFFVFGKAGKFKTSLAWVLYNQLLTNLACLSRTGEYWPSVILYRPRCTRSTLPLPPANILQYSPCTRFSKRLIWLTQSMGKWVQTSHSWFWIYFWLYPSHVAQLVQNQNLTRFLNIHNYSTRQSMRLSLPNVIQNFGKRTFLFVSAKFFNNLP